MSNAGNNMTDFNWNPTPEDSDVTKYHITNFKLTRSDGEMNSLLIEQSGVDEKFFQLQGDLVSCTDPTFKKRFEVLVKQYFIDLGVPSNPSEPNPTSGFWMVGKDPDCHFKLVLPADAEFRDHANVVDLPENIRLLRHYQFPFNAAYCLHLSKFSLTDRDMGGHQTPILSAFNKMLLALRGVISVNDETNKLSAVFPNYGDLRIQTYVQNKYAIDLGADPFVLRPEFCLEDCHRTWFRLTLPPHVTYRADFTNTLMRTVNHMAAYNWPAERDETWRHVTNYRLTDKAGDLHGLEIAHLNTEFTLWAELVPPPRASCPPIQILLQVNSYAIDTGRSLYDTDKGVWMQDVRGDWYKLGDPAPDYRTIADPLLEKAAQYIRFHDALVFQDRSAEISLYLQNKGKYLSNWKLTAVHQKANPKFELYFIQQNKDFVIQHVEADFDATGSCFLMASINELTGVKPPVRAGAPANGGPSKLNGDNGASTGRLRSITNDTAKEASGLSDSDNDVPLRRSKHLRSRDGSTGSENKRQRSNSENDVAAAAPRRITKKTIAVEEDEDSPAEPSKPVVAAMSAPPSSQVSRNGGGRGGSGSQAPPQRLELPNAAKPSTTSVAAPSTVPPVPAKPRMNRFTDADDELPGHMPPPPPKERPLQRSVSDEPSFYGATASSAASKPPLPVAPPPPVVAPPQIPSAKPPVPSLPKPTSKEDFTKTLQAYMQASALKPVEAPAPQSRVAPPPPFPPRASTGNVVPPKSGASVYQPPHRAAAPAPPAPPQKQPQENTAASGMARWEAYSRQTTGVAVTALASRNTQPESAMLNVMRTASGSQPEDNAGRRVDPRDRPSRWDADAVVAPSIKAIEPIPAGGGRGRGATLPAWYTEQTDRTSRVDPHDAQPRPPDNASQRVDPRDRPFRSDAVPMSVPAVIGIDPIPPGGGRGRGATLPAWVTEQRKHDEIVIPSDRNDRRVEHASQFQDAPRTAGVDQYGRQDQISVFSTDTRRDDAGRPKGILKSSSQYPDQPGATSRERSYERDNQYTGWRQPPQGEFRPLQVQQDRSRSRSRERAVPDRAVSMGDDRRHSYPQDGYRDRVWRGEQDGRYGRSSGDDSYRSGPPRAEWGSSSRDPYVQPFVPGARSGGSSAPRVVEEDVGDFRGGRRTAPRQPDRAVTEPFPARNRGAEDGFGRAPVEQSQPTISGFPQQSMTAPPPQRAAPSSRFGAMEPDAAPRPGTTSQSVPSAGTKPSKTRVDCSQCRGIMKKPTCTNDAHINGQQVRVSLAAAAPPAVPAAAANPPLQQQRMRETPELDVEVGIDSSAANSDAAFAFLNMVQTLTVDPNGGVINLDVSSDEATTREIVSSALVDLHSSPVPSPVSSPRPGAANPVVPVFRSDEEVQSDRVGSRVAQRADNKQPQDSLRVQTTDGTAGAAADHRAEPASPAKKDELSAERARYLRTKQHHSAESASEDGDKNKGKPGVIVSPRHGVWGRGIALPKADSAAPPMAVFKLGGRQDDPKKRLEQTRRNSLGVYATTSAENMGERHAPPSASARPTKSAMRSTSNNGSNGGNGGSGSDDNRSAAGSSTGSAVAKPVKWRDMEGGSALYVRHSYENENDVSSEGLAN